MRRRPSSSPSHNNEKCAHCTFIAVSFPPAGRYGQPGVRDAATAAAQAVKRAPAEARKRKKEAAAALGAAVAAVQAAPGSGATPAAKKGKKRDAAY